MQSRIQGIYLGLCTSGTDAEGASFPVSIGLPVNGVLPFMILVLQNNCTAWRCIKYAAWSAGERRPQAWLGRVELCPIWPMCNFSNAICWFKAAPSTLAGPAWGVYSRGIEEGKGVFTFLTSEMEAYGRTVVKLCLLFAVDWIGSPKDSLGWRGLLNFPSWVKAFFSVDPWVCFTVLGAVKIAALAARSPLSPVRIAVGVVRDFKSSDSCIGSPFSWDESWDCDLRSSVRIV